MQKLLPGITGRSFFMDPAIRDLTLLYPQEASNINRKVNPKSGKEPYLFRADKPGHLRGSVLASCPQRCLSHEFPQHTI